MLPKNTDIPFNKKTEVTEFAKFISQLVREGIVFKVDFTNDNFIVVITGGF